MSIVVVLEHREDTGRSPPVRLTLTGVTLITQVGGSRPSIQTLPDREEAQQNLERALRLRQDEGYRILERSEIACDDVESIVDTVAYFVWYDEARKRAHVDFEEGPVSPKEIVEVVARLVAAAPACMDHLRSDEIPGGLLATALAGKGLPSVKALVYLTYLVEADHRLPLDDLADLFAALPSLERVAASGRFALREANHGALCELHLESAQMLPGPIAALGAGSLPALSTLGLTLGKGHGLDRRAATALRSLDAPRLQAIEVVGLENVTTFLAELVESPLPASWVMLYVQGSVADEDALLAVLRERAPVLRSIAMLALPLADELSEGGVAEAKALLPGVVDVCDVPELWSPTSTEAW